MSTQSKPKMTLRERITKVLYSRPFLVKSLMSSATFTAVIIVFILLDKVKLKDPDQMIINHGVAYYRYIKRLVAINTVLAVIAGLVVLAFGAWLYAMPRLQAKKDAETAKAKQEIEKLDPLHDWLSVFDSFDALIKRYVDTQDCYAPNSSEQGAINCRRIQHALYDMQVMRERFTSLLETAASSKELAYQNYPTLSLVNNDLIAAHCAILARAKKVRSVLIVYTAGETLPDWIGELADANDETLAQSAKLLAESANYINSKAEDVTVNLANLADAMHEMTNTIKPSK